MSELYILDIRQEDEGIYYCRLTFQNQQLFKNQLKNPVSSQSLPLQPNMKKKLSFGEDLTAEYKNGQSSLDQESERV